MQVQVHKRISIQILDLVSFASWAMLELSASEFLIPRLTAHTQETLLANYQRADYQTGATSLKAPQNSPNNFLLLKMH